MKINYKQLLGAFIFLACGACTSYQKDIVQSWQFQEMKVHFPDSTYNLTTNPKDYWAFYENNTFQSYVYFLNFDSAVYNGIWEIRQDTLQITYQSSSAVSLWKIIELNDVNLHIFEIDTSQALKEILFTSKNQ